MEVVDPPEKLIETAGANTNAVIAQLSESPFITRLCDALIADLRDLTELYAAVGEHAFRGFNAQRGITMSWQTVGPWKGSYVGFGLSEYALNFGPLAAPVIASLRKRFKKDRTAQESWSGEPYDTLVGTLCSNDEIYATPDGTFWLSHTYAWFVKRRVN